MPAALPLDQAGVEEDAQMVAHCRLAEPEEVSDVADTCFVRRVGLKQAENTQPCGTGEHPQKRGEPHGRRLIERAGVALKTASARLGHSGIAITADLYQRVAGDPDADAAQGVADVLSDTAVDHG